MAATITLTTDWSKNDFYTASVMAAVSSEHPDANIVSINNGIDTHNIATAAFILRAVYKRFAPGTIHIIGIRSIATKEHPHIVVKHHQQYFIGADNGIFSLVFGEIPELIVKLDSKGAFKGSTFPELSVFSGVACFIAGGGNITDLGEKTEKLYLATGFEPVLEKDKISGKVIYIDSYGNAITNINKKFWDEHIGAQNFELIFNHMANKVTRIHQHYSEVSPGNLVVLFNSLGLLEIALRDASVAQLLNLSTDTEIMIRSGAGTGSLFT